MIQPSWIGCSSKLWPASSLMRSNSKAANGWIRSCTARSSPHGHNCLRRFGDATSMKQQKMGIQYNQAKMKAWCIYILYICNNQHYVTIIKAATRFKPRGDVLSLPEKATDCVRTSGRSRGLALHHNIPPVFNWHWWKDISWNLLGPFVRWKVNQRCFVSSSSSKLHAGAWTRTVGASSKNHKMDLVMAWMTWGSLKIC